MKNLLLIISLALFLIACDDDSSTSSLDIETNSSGTITGKVYSRSDFEPVNNVLIRTNPPTEDLFTDSNGEFVISNIDEGIYKVYATKPDYYSNYTLISMRPNETKSAIIEMSTIVENNSPPSKVNYVYPVQNQMVPFNRSIFRWSSIDPDLDRITYDVFLDTEYPPMEKIASDLNFDSLIIEDLQLNEKYYLQINSKDFFGAITEGDIIEFETSDEFLANPDYHSYFNMDSGFEIDSKANLSSNPEIKVERAQFVNDRHGNLNAATQFNSAQTTSIVWNDQREFQFSNNFTISMWVKPGSTVGRLQGDYVDLFGKWGGEGNGNSSFSVILKGDYTLGAGIHNGSNFNFLWSQTQLTPNQWSQISITFKDSEIEFFLNAQSIFKQGSQMIPLILPQFSNHWLNFGKRNDNQAFYNGALDEVYYFDRVLNTEEIQALYEL